jgi:hypothetical protein
MPNTFWQQIIIILHKKLYILYSDCFLSLFIHLRDSSLATSVLFYSINFTIYKKILYLRNQAHIL